MNFEKLKSIDHYLRKQQTGNATEFANKVGVSKSMLHRYIDYMKKELNAPIQYSRTTRSYSYTEKGKLYVEGWICEVEMDIN